MFEFSEEVGGRDGAASAACEHFIVAVKSWDSQKICSTGNNLPDLSALPTSVTIGAEALPQTGVMAMRMARRALKLEGSGPVDLVITLDYSDAFFRTELILRAGTGETTPSLLDSDAPDAKAALEVKKALAPSSVEYNRKQATTYRFNDLPAGDFDLRLR